MAPTVPKFTRLDKPARADCYGLADSVIGSILCVWQGGMLVRVQLLPAYAEDHLNEIMADANLSPDLKRDDARAKTFSRQVLFPANQWVGQFPSTLEAGFHGTDFQWAVMQQMLNTPMGKTTSYASLALAAQKPGASRAAGSVCANNPLPFIIPCHRILTSQGGLGGYAYGTALKRQLLEWEKSSA